MWSRISLDLTWRDLAYIPLLVFKKSSFDLPQKTADAWPSQHSVLPALSVRSAFDLMLRSLNFPKGSEIIFSAITVPGMLEIAVAHGLVPVCADIDENGFLIEDFLKSIITEKTRMIIVAHLFGGRSPLDGVQRLVKDRGIFVVEDCAQAFRKVGDGMAPGADAALYSFGPIKSATALGGSIAVIRDQWLYLKMRNISDCDEKQSTLSYIIRTLRFAFLWFISKPKMMELLYSLAHIFQFEVDSVLNNLGKGFSGKKLLQSLRKRPCHALLYMMLWRFKHYRSLGVEKKIEMGRELDRVMGTSRPVGHHYWIYAAFVEYRAKWRSHLVANGFDATFRCRLCVVPQAQGFPEPECVMKLWEKILFIPLYESMPKSDFRKLVDLISTLKGKKSQNKAGHDKKEVDHFNQRPTLLDHA